MYISLVSHHVFLGMLFLDTPCRMFVYLFVVQSVLSSGIIKETMNE